jgi:hypothetical protein
MYVSVNINVVGAVGLDLSSLRAPGSLFFFVGPVIGRCARGGYRKNTISLPTAVE